MYDSRIQKIGQNENKQVVYVIRPKQGNLVYRPEAKRYYIISDIGLHGDTGLEYMDKRKLKPSFTLYTNINQSTTKTFNAHNNWKTLYAIQRKTFLLYGQKECFRKPKHLCLQRFGHQYLSCGIIECSLSI